jgi:hypothetical protein
MSGRTSGGLPRPPGTPAEIFAKERGVSTLVAVAAGVIVDAEDPSWAWLAGVTKVPVAGVAGEDTTPGNEMSG